MREMEVVAFLVHGALPFFGDLFRRGETTASLSTNKANFVALSNVLYQVISILSRDNLMSGEEETDLTEIVDSVVKSVRKG